MPAVLRKLPRRPQIPSKTRDPAASHTTGRSADNATPANKETLWATSKSHCSNSFAGIIKAAPADTERPESSSAPPPSTIAGATAHRVSRLATGAAREKLPKYQSSSGTVNTVAQQVVRRPSPMSSTRLDSAVRRLQRFRCGSSSEQAGPTSTRPHTEAKESCRLTDKSAQEIADECGFTDASYFSKSFKGAFGITPKDYRNGFKNEFI